MPTFTRVRAYLAAAIVAVLAAITVVITVPGDDPSKPPATITVRLGAPALQRADVPDTLEIPKDALAAAKRSNVDDHDGSRDEVPDGVPADELRAGQRQQDDLAQRDDLPIVTPAAAPQQAGCRSTFVQNYSSRRGVRPQVIVPHYTVSANRPGWSDVNAIVGLFNTPSFAASSNYVVDDEAHCAYIVRESDKAWTQATFNPVAISIEIIATGREGRLTSAAGYAKLGRIISDAGKRWGIPLRQGAVKGCTVTKPGIVTHQMLGSCGGGHVDVSPYPLAPILAAASAARGGQPTGASSATKTERTKVTLLQRERTIAKRNHGWSKVGPSHLRTARAAKAWIQRRLVTITTGEQANRPARRVYLRAALG